MTNFLSKQEREKLREHANRFSVGQERDFTCFTSPEVIALLDHIEALEGRIEKANEVIRIVADPDVFPSYHSQGMGCGLEDRDITDRYEAMRYGWDSLADRIHDEIIVFAEEYQTAIASAPECQTCNGHGMIGGFVSAESGYQSDPCPDCNSDNASEGKK